MGESLREALLSAWRMKGSLLFERASGKHQLEVSGWLDSRALWLPSPLKLPQLAPPDSLSSSEGLGFQRDVSRAYTPVESAAESLVRSPQSRCPASSHTLCFVALVLEKQS